MLDVMGRRRAVSFFWIEMLDGEYVLKRKAFTIH